jgi:hypothetical protein
MAAHGIIRVIFMSGSRAALFAFELVGLDINDSNGNGIKLAEAL